MKILVCLFALVLCGACCEKGSKDKRESVSRIEERTTRTDCASKCAIENTQAELDSWNNGPKAAQDNIQRQMAKDKVEGKWHLYNTDGSVGPEIPASK